MTYEEWRPVVGWEGCYEVSSHGRVRSVPRLDSQGRLIKGRIRRLHKNTGGHRVVDLKIDGLRRTVQVHRLVAEAFIPNSEAHPYVLHWDDDPENNHVTNLRWGTKSDNGRDQVRNGLHPWAKRTECSRGHTYTPESSYHSGRQRVCRLCRREDYGVREPPEHGSYSGYVSFGCRCEPCRDAGRRYRRGRNDISKAKSAK